MHSVKGVGEQSFNPFNPSNPGSDSIEGELEDLIQKQFCSVFGWVGEDVVWGVDFY